jgi:hypothetical protein
MHPNVVTGDVGQVRGFGIQVCDPTVEGAVVKNGLGDEAVDVVQIELICAVPTTSA